MNFLPAITSIASESVVQLPRFQTKAGERTINLCRILYLSAQENYVSIEDMIDTNNRFNHSW